MRGGGLRGFLGSHSPRPPTGLTLPFALDTSGGPFLPLFDRAVLPAADHDEGQAFSLMSPGRARCNAAEHLAAEVGSGINVSPGISIRRAVPLASEGIWKDIGLLL